MVANQNSENPNFKADEGWWASVLADEERYSSAPPAKPARQAKPPEKVKEEQPANPDWGQAKRLYRQDEIIALRVVGFNRGGLLVEGNDLQGFVPFSHLVDVDEISDKRQRERVLGAYVGRTLQLKVIECVPEDGRVVFSERAALAGAGQRARLFSMLQAGNKVNGEVTNITDFGVFVDLGGVEGLIHISELSWGRVAHPRQIVSLGQKIEVQVLEISPERCRVALSLKRLEPNPWEDAESRFSVDQVVPAEITAIMSYGAFARLENGIEGLVHASEMLLNPGMTARDFLKIGQSVQVRILHVDASSQRLGLSMKVDA
ncbi:MAG: S1 RNA-binding domain-containing protein [Chloroflexota bacterium]